MKSRMKHVTDQLATLVVDEYNKGTALQTIADMVNARKLYHLAIDTSWVSTIAHRHGCARRMKRAITPAGSVKRGRGKGRPKVQDVDMLDLMTDILTSNITRETQRLLINRLIK